MELIHKRRSIRKYKLGEVTPEQVNEILSAAMAAPSAGNQQSWEFIIVKKRETLDAMNEAHPYSRMLQDVDLAIVVCGDTQREYAPGFWIQDCSAATQNILLAACSLGLGSVWLGVHPIAERVSAISKILELPENIIPLSIIPIGYPDEEKGPSNRFDPVKIHLEKW